MLGRITALISVCLVLGLNSAHAGIFPPRKASVCIVVFKAVDDAPKPSSDEYKYLKNSLKSFRENALGGLSAQPIAPEGYLDSTGGSRGLTFSKAAGRVAGIEFFMKETGGEIERSNQSRFIQTVTISGKENIENFVSSLRTQVHTPPSRWARTFIFAQDSLAMAFVSSVQLPAVQSVSELLFWVGVHAVSTGGDAFVRRPFLWEMKLSSDITSAMAALESTTGGWSLVSRNYRLVPGLVKALRVRSEKDFYREEGNQLLGESLGVLPRKLFELIDKSRRETWVGVDMFFERSPGGEPELHVIIRGSETRPKFPKKSTEKSKVKTEARPGIIPGSVPTP